MLLQFSTRNHISLRDEIEISLVASTLKDDPTGLISLKNLNHQALPAAVIYGANASGKSNLLNAISFMRGQVLQSHARALPDERIPRRPFALNKTSRNEPSWYSMAFVVDGIRFQYEFECTDTEFTSEGLYSFASGRRTKLFERRNQQFDFGRSLKGRNQLISELTRKNSLFISTAAQNDHDELTKIYRFFLEMHVNMTIAPEGHVESFDFRDESIDHRVITFLENIGTGVVDFKNDEIEYSDEQKEFNRKFMDLIRSISPKIESIDEDHKAVQIELGHTGEHGEIYFLELRSESAGTRRLLFLLRRIFKALDMGGLIFVDELDASLHTQACEAVLALFSSNETNPNGAQIVVTTHDTNLLASDLIRRDQIWLCQKERDGSSRIYPLTDFHTRREDNLERGYLDGRFGGTPFTGSARGLARLLRRD